MVDLPRYVKPQPKKNGRVYYYYERYRNTPRALPRVPLPGSPQSPDFWVRCHQYQNLEASRDGNGAWCWHWASDQGEAYPLPDPHQSVEAFWAALDKVALAERDRLAGVNKTFMALVAQYKDHEAYKKLSESSRGDYNRYLDVILAAWGNDPVANLTTEIAQAAVDSYQSAPASGRYFRSVLSKLVAFGIPRGYCSSNPVEHTEKIAYEKQPYKPWPDWAFELFFEHARIGLHLTVYSALYTGQRSVDVIPMLRPRQDADVIELVARKTKKAVWVPIHSEYRQILDATRPIATTGVVPIERGRLHLREDGEPWTYEGYKTAWQRDLTFTATGNDREATVADREKAAAMKRLRDEGLVFHGLRKCAVNMLLEVGSTEAEVAAIVEMSEQMVRHYSKDVNKRRLAVNAMKKLEEGWSQTRERLFGVARNRLSK